MQEKLVQYVNGRGSRKNQREGVLLGCKHVDGDGANIVIITGSHVNIQRGDRYDPQTAMRIAEGRQAKAFGSGKNEIASSMRKDLAHFSDRCRRYFKGCSIILPTLAVSQDEQD